MNRLHVLLFGFLLALMSVNGTAQTRPEGHRIVTMTRLQVVFSDLENQWLAAIQKKDNAALDKLLVDTFEVWTPTQAEPIPLEDWRQQAFSHALQSFTIRKLAVRAVNENVSVVSFVLSQSYNEGGKNRTDDEFVVDVWLNDGQSWHCTDRYASSVPATNAPREDVKPSGKQ